MALTIAVGITFAFFLFCVCYVFIGAADEMDRSRDLCDEIDRENAELQRLREERRRLREARNHGP
jgi:phosphotransferase system  glucose/maltose/N-acetylglucosamine-specific IIC component